MTNHTPGPWYVGSVYGHLAIYAKDQAGETDDPMICEMDVDEPVNHNANARLIAAAPELLEALQDICDEQDERQGYASHEAYDKARAAIAKAKGGQS